jgi:uncharacterized protein with HEPN domain
MSRHESSLIDIVNAGKRIQNYVVGSDKDSIEADSQARAAVHYECLFIGEAVKQAGLDADRLTGPSRGPILNAVRSKSESPAHAR